MGNLRRSHCGAPHAIAGLSLLFTLCGGALGAQWGCYGTKPGHPTPEERAAFIREVSELAVKAEARHGVPASALAAIAIAESGYGYTRLALHANNLFGWKFLSRSAAEGRKAYFVTCRQRKRVNDGFIAFGTRAESFDYVAAKLATLDKYRGHTEAYKAARQRGEPAESAVKAWLQGIAARYSRKPAEFTKKIIRIMNHAVEPSDAIADEHNLYRLSAALKR
jgi:flagellum-specific peptidoglycan hydrolase FlgJ